MLMKGVLPSLAIFVRCAGAMESGDVESIRKPSDLFGREILTEYTSTSEYGVLKFNAVVIPDLSKDKESTDFFAKHLYMVRDFIRTDNLVSRYAIAKTLRNAADTPQNRSWTELLSLSSLCRLAEDDSFFGKEYKEEFFGAQTDDVLAQVASYNGNPLTKTLACSASMYMISLFKCLNSNLGIYARNFSYSIDKSSRIMTNGHPRKHFLSWAFMSASNDATLLGLVSEKNQLNLLNDLFRSWTEEPHLHNYNSLQSLGMTYTNRIDYNNTHLSSVMTWHNDHSFNMSINYRF